jgi:hypothetical protein
MVTVAQDQALEHASFVMQPRSHRAETRGSNWIHAGLEVRETPGCGLGVFAGAAIPANTTVIVYGGIILTEEEFEALPEELQHFPFNISEGFFLAPRDRNDLGIGERINHSCQPTVGFSGQVTLVTLQDVKKGEEITMDYATCVASDDGAFVMKCGCGARGCRGIVTGQDWKLPEVQHRLLPYFQPFLQERVRRQASLRLPSEPVNSDRVKTLDYRDSLARQLLVSLPRAIAAFVITALKQEWMAIPICVIAGIPSTIFTVLVMMTLGPLVQSFGWFVTEASFVAAFSLMTSIVGYATYLVMYYAGMLLKERGDWVRRGRLDWVALRTKLRVVKYDFIAHLPSDLWVMPMIGVAQGGMMLAGASQLWAIVVAHTLSDVAYAIKEPLFWHGAKQLVAWRDRRIS